MIALLTGHIARKSASGVILDVSGVGYEVLCPLSVLDALPATHEKAVLSIYTHVREDQITLFGFNDEDEKRLFRLLISVSGIGPKLGLACLSGMNSDDLCDAIRSEDAKRLSTIPGIGKRTAERLILELKTKVGHSSSTLPVNQSSMMDDLASALKNLGYKDKDVDQLITGLDVGPEPKFETLLREALKQLRKGTR
jgi:Holliday junction DNA helicase RuvA